MNAQNPMMTKPVRNVSCLWAILLYKTLTA